MKYIYTEKDLDLISWDRIDNFINKIYKEVNNYLIKANLKIKYIVPIMRGGGVPAIIFSHLFDVIDMLPIQLKYNYEIMNIDKKIRVDYVKNTNIDSN